MENNNEKANKIALKQKADKLGNFLGYKMEDGLIAIDMREMYCQGYTQALKDENDKAKKILRE